MTTGPCWSCDAPESPAYRCQRGHSWFCCEETCGQKVSDGTGPYDAPAGVVEWDDCPECREDERQGEEEWAEANADRRHF